MTYKLFRDKKILAITQVEVTRACGVSIFLLIDWCRARRASSVRRSLVSPERTAASLLNSLGTESGAVVARGRRRRGGVYSTLSFWGSEPNKQPMPACVTSPKALWGWHSLWLKCTMGDWTAQCWWAMLAFRCDDSYEGPYGNRSCRYKVFCSFSFPSYPDTRW